MQDGSFLPKDRLHKTNYIPLLDEPLLDEPLLHEVRALHGLKTKGSFAEFHLAASALRNLSL